MIWEHPVRRSLCYLAPMKKRTNPKHNLTDPKRLALEQQRRLAARALLKRRRQKSGQ